MVFEPFGLFPVLRLMFFIAFIRSSSCFIIETSFIDTEKLWPTICSIFCVISRLYNKFLKAFSVERKVAHATSKITDNLKNLCS